jgi:hypothetical protein
VTLTDHGIREGGVGQAYRSVSLRNALLILLKAGRVVAIHPDLLNDVKGWKTARFMAKNA